MSQPITCASVTGFAAELAELLVETETVQSDSDRTTRDAARREFLADAEKQVAELHEAATATATGALVGAAFTIAGAACSAASSVYKFDADTADECHLAERAMYARDAGLAQSLGQGFSGLSAYASTLTGSRVSDDHKAEAKRAELHGEQARWQVDDATTEINRASQLGDKLLDILQSLNQDQTSANNAIIGRM